MYTCIERWSHYMASRFEQSRRFLAVWSFQKQYHQSVPAGWAFMVVELPEGSNSNTYRPVFALLQTHLGIVSSNHLVLKEF